MKREDEMLEYCEKHRETSKREIDSKRLFLAHYHDNLTFTDKLLFTLATMLS